MANLNQGEPGYAPAPHEGPVELANEERFFVDGREHYVQLFTDGTRKVWLDGKLIDQDEDESDLDVPSAEPADQPTEPEHELEASDEDDDLADRIADRTQEHLENAPEGLTPAQANDIITTMGAGASGQLNELQGPQPATHEEPSQGVDAPLWPNETPEAGAFADESPVEDAEEAARAAVGNPDDEDESVVVDDGDNKEKASEGFEVDLEDLAGDVKVEAEKLWKSVKGFEEKTVQELKDFAHEHNINLHGATTKKDIVKAIKKEDKHA